MASAREEWRLCADWLVKCLIIAPDHKVNEPSAEVFDLAQVLRDGVLICHLLNRLHDGAIDPKDFSQRPQMSQFLCLKNIRVFLTTCRSLFGLRESDLFDPYDLFDVKDFGKVISTLSKLSKTPQAQKSQIPGFPPSNTPLRRNSTYYNMLEDKATGFPSEKTVRMSTGHQMYRELENLASAHEIDDDPIYDIPNREDEMEEIYGDVMSIMKSSVKLKVKKEPEPKSKRDYCLKELTETERNYVDALKMIMQHFIKPMKTCLSAQDHNTIFMCIEELYDIHKTFHADLTKAVGNTGTTGLTIADCFITYKGKLLIYGQFCSNLPKAQEKVDELCKRSKAVREKVMDCQKAANDGKFRLRDLLSVPMQRVLKYHLLLRELIRQTEPQSPQRQGLETALEAMQDLSLYVNEVKRDNEALQLIMEIQSSINDLEMPGCTTLKDYGQLLKDGELKVKSHEDQRVKLRYIFLFDKVILMCRSRGDTYNYKHAMVTSQFRVDDFHKSGKDKGDTYNAKNALATSQIRVDNSRKSGKDKWTHQFILAPAGPGTPAYTFMAKTDEIRSKWIEAIAMALDNTSPPGALEGGHEFIMSTFDKPTICDVCRKLLRGVFHQGYRCQKTGLAVHKECIIKAKDLSGPPVRPPVRYTGSGSTSPTGGAPPPTPTRLGDRVKVVFDYKGTPPPDNGRRIIQLRKDDVLEVLDRTDPSWLKGRLMSGEEGYFPAYCVNPHRQGRRDSQRGYLDWTVEASPAEVQNNASPTSPPTSPYYNVVGEIDLKPFPWFVGEMSRQTAAKKLERLMSGTFLIRESVGERRGEYALSIKFSGSVKHIRIQTGPDAMYYLADCKMFRNIPDLVHYYQHNSLHVSFPDLQTNLLIPFKDAVKSGQVNDSLGTCRALYDYAANQPNQISLTAGERLTIVSKLGGDRGWWKGRNLAGKTGFFPSAYVEELDDL